MAEQKPNHRMPILALPIKAEACSLMARSDYTPKREAMWPHIREVMRPRKYEVIQGTRQLPGGSRPGGHVRSLRNLNCECVDADTLVNLHRTAGQRFYPNFNLPNTNKHF
jgi:hypothetical protein